MHRRDLHLCELLVSRMTLPSTETAGLPFEEDNQGMYGDWDSPEENAAAWMLEVANRTGWYRAMLVDCLAALAIAVATCVALYAVDAQPGKMLSMFSPPSVTADIPTVYAPTGEWKRRP